MSDKNKTEIQLGYFIDIATWKDALKLLNFQIKQKKKNRHFNTLSMFYYESLDTTCINTCLREYFDTKIASSLFYGLKKEFCVVSHVIPKKGLRLRDYKFFTYPMRAVYYAVGLYLLQLSQEFISEVYNKTESIEAFYGGNLTYKCSELQLGRESIYYLSFYKEFRIKANREIESSNRLKVVLQLDIENCFDNISIPKLLNSLSHFTKPSVQVRMRYDAATKEQIICFFRFLSNSNVGIPQSENNIVSGFVGHLYLAFGDLLLDDLLNSCKNTLASHKIIRYVDDVYISVEFKEDVSEKNQSSFIHELSSQISEIFYREIGLKLNAKTKLYHLSNDGEKQELLKNIKRVSHGSQYFYTIEDSKPDVDSIQEDINEIFDELEKIKNSRIEEYFIGENSARQESLRLVFDKSIDNLLNKRVNRDRIKRIFNDFDFNLVKVQPFEILIVLLKDETTKAEFRDFCLKKSVVTTLDVDLIVRFLCQTGFNDDELIDKLSQNSHMRDIVSLFRNKQLNCNLPGYYDLSCMQIKKVSEMPEVLEQTRLRVMSERSLSYSVALNHLVNELQAVCVKLERANKKDYDVNSVVKYLKMNGVSHVARIKIRNMFDLRNSNSVSHPSDETNITLGVTEQEYSDYSKYVGQCLAYIL